MSGTGSIRFTLFLSYLKLNFTNVLICSGLQSGVGRKDVLLINEFHSLLSDITNYHNRIDCYARVRSNLERRERY